MPWPNGYKASDIVQWNNLSRSPQLPDPEEEQAWFKLKEQVIKAGGSLRGELTGPLKMDETGNFLEVRNSSAIGGAAHQTWWSGVGHRLSKFLQRFSGKETERIPQSKAKLVQCDCGDEQQHYRLATIKTAKNLPALLLSLLIAFFPKCPLCWAVYMSSFSCIGLSGLSYMNWLLPVLMAFFGLHLFILYYRSKSTGYTPFIISLAGTVMIVSGQYFSFPHWYLITGMILIGIGSIRHSLLSFTNTKRILN